MKTEYITIKTHKHLIGKRAKFKDNLSGYTKDLWKAEGTIQQLNLVKEGDLNHIGLSLVFDKPIGENGRSMGSCYIMPESFILIGDEE